MKLNLEILKNNDKISIDDFEQIWRFLKQRVATGFVFDEAPEINNQSIAILEKDEKLSFSSSKMKDNLQNSLIIGENYDVLKNLIGVEREREDANFDLIYIDPPYNTQKTSDDGNNLTDDEITADKFIYRDKFSRTGWLNLLNERLKLAKQLLKEDGVIFVSIDDNEQAYLKVLMDEIFGEE
ncbi:DNA methyltransferase, partial [Mesomycoplasma hyorhinis]|uniref:DNA methyltransferase n=1 Tax=Mesomycoplasma hyorhinis TaxID=2100 RepID=UPI003A5C7D93